MSFTPRNIQQQNAERRLRNRCAQAQPSSPWPWFIVAMFFVVFFVPLILAAAS